MNQDLVEPSGTENMFIINRMEERPTRAEEKESEKRKEIFDRLQLINELKEVKSRLNKIITSDFVLASFSEKQKEFIVDMLKNAMFARNTLLLFGRTGKYVWDDDLKDWRRNVDGTFKRVPLSKDEQERINSSANALFTAYMIEPLTMSILERNKPKNFLLKLLITGDQDKENEEEEEAREKAESIAEKIGQFFTGKKSKGEDIAE